MDICLSLWVIIQYLHYYGFGGSNGFSFGHWLLFLFGFYVFLMCLCPSAHLSIHPSIYLLIFEHFPTLQNHKILEACLIFSLPLARIFVFLNKEWCDKRSTQATLWRTNGNVEGARVAMLKLEPRLGGGVEEEASVATW